jgi:hypothetical protein
LFIFSSTVVPIWLLRRIKAEMSLLKVNKTSRDKFQGHCMGFWFGSKFVDGFVGG